MNIAKIMIPKISTVFLHEKDTIRQGLERFMHCGHRQQLSKFIGNNFSAQ